MLQFELRNIPPTDVVSGTPRGIRQTQVTTFLSSSLNVLIFVRFASHHRLKVNASSSHRAEAHRRVGGFECEARRFGEDKTVGCDTPNPVQVTGWEGGDI